jgi:hypothetical protein
MHEEPQKSFLEFVEIELALLGDCDFEGWKALAWPGLTYLSIALILIPYIEWKRLNLAVFGWLLLLNLSLLYLCFVLIVERAVGFFEDFKREAVVLLRERFGEARIENACDVSLGICFYGFIAFFVLSFALQNRLLSHLLGLKITFGE